MKAYNRLKSITDPLKVHLLSLLILLTLFLPATAIVKSAYASTPVPLKFADEAVGKLPNVTVQSATQTQYSQTFAKLIGQILGIVMAVAGLALLVMFLWGGIEWVTSGNDKGKLEKARGRMVQGALGIFVLGASVALFGVIQQILNICIIKFGPFSCKTGTSVVVGTTTPGPGFATSLGGFLTSMLTVVMAVAGLALLIMLLWGGISWITSGGDKSKAEEARSRITTAIIGMIVLAAAYALLLLVLQILGFQNFTGLFTNIKSLN